MITDDWIQRWNNGQIGFHLAEVNDRLLHHEREVFAGCSSVFVPLCGKSRDVAWLARRGYRVHGVECAETAVRALFDEAGIAWEMRSEGRFKVFEGANIRIDCGDLFDLSGPPAIPFDAVYDRASLIALPPSERLRYSRLMISLLKPRGRMLLVGVEYNTMEMQGPPFSVPWVEVATSYGSAGRLDFLDMEDILEKEPRFKQRGLTWLREYCLAFEKRP